MEKQIKKEETKNQIVKKLQDIYSLLSKSSCEDNVILSDLNQIQIENIYIYKVDIR